MKRKKQVSKKKKQSNNKTIKLIRKIGYKKKRPSFRYKMNEDYYGNAAIRTKYERLFESFLKEADIPYLVNQVFCFSCNQYFTFESMNMPEKCAGCNINFKKENIFGERGYLARPDFLLNYNSEFFDNKFDMKNIGIIRIDGRVHDLKKATRKTDYHILNAFKDRGVKVFIIRNETLLEKTVLELQELVQSINLMMNDDDLYNKYAKSKEFEELSYCPDIEIRRYNRPKKN